MSHLWVLLETDVFGVGKKNMGLRGTLVFCVCFFLSLLVFKTCQVCVTD